MDARTFWQFEPALGRILREFIFQPSADLHPDRMQALWPEGMAVSGVLPQGDAALSRALIRVLELGDDVPLDLDQPLHRCALMPSQGLAVVARALEVRWLAPVLRRVILRGELQSLEPLMGKPEWALALSEPDPVPKGMRPASLQDLTIDEWLPLFDHLGWVVLEFALGNLPRPVALRACLKLPVREIPKVAQSITPHGAQELVEAVYPEAAARWSSRWDDDWISRRAA